MINKQALNRIIDLVQRGEQILPGEISILRDAVDLLDDLVTLMDKIMRNQGEITMLETILQYQVETTQALKIIEQGNLPVNRQTDTKPAGA
jgi:hypothetical protein